jgi:hypothetical protein
MSHQSGLYRFRGLFDAAIQEYEKTTKMALTKHPLADQLRNCPSVESTATFLQDKAREFGDFRGSDRIIMSIKNTVSVLSMLSASPTRGDAVHLVCLRALILSAMQIIIYSHLRLRRQYKLASPFYLTYVSFLSFCALYPSQMSASGRQGGECQP